MTWTARAAIRKSLEQLQAILEPDLPALRALVAQRSRAQVEEFLRAHRELGLSLAEGGQQRRKTLDTLPAADRLVAAYAGAAWSAKALTLIEYLERADLTPDYPPRFALRTSLGLIEDYETDPAWLWPLPAPSPWPEDDED